MLEARSNRAFNQFVEKLQRYDLQQLNNDFVRMYLKAKYSSAVIKKRHKKPPIQTSEALAYDIYVNRTDDPTTEEGLISLLQAAVSFKDARVTLDCHLATGDDYNGEFEVSVKCGKSRLALVIVKDSTEISARLAAIWSSIIEFCVPLNKIIISDYITATRSVLNADYIPPEKVLVNKIVINETLSVVTYDKDLTRKLSILSNLSAKDCYSLLPDPVYQQWWNSACTSAGVVGMNLLSLSSVTKLQTAGGQNQSPSTSIFKISVSLARNQKDYTFMEIQWKPKKKIDAEVNLKPEDIRASIWDILTEGLHERVKDLAGLVFLHVYWHEMFVLLTEEATRIKIEEMSAIQMQKTLEVESSRFMARSGIIDYFQPSDRSISKDLRQLDFRLNQRKTEILQAEDGSINEKKEKTENTVRKIDDILVSNLDKHIHESYIQMAQYLFKIFRESILKVDNYEFVRLVGQPIFEFSPKLPVLTILDDEFLKKAEFELREVSMEIKINYIQESQEYKAVLKTPGRSLTSRVKFTSSSPFSYRIPTYFALEQMIPLLASKIAADTLANHHHPLPQTKPKTAEKSINTDFQSTSTVPETTTESATHTSLQSRPPEDTRTLPHARDQQQMTASHEHRSINIDEISEIRPNPSNSNIFYEESIDTSRMSSSNVSVIDTLINKDIMDQDKDCHSICGLCWLQNNTFFSTGKVSYHEGYLDTLRKVFYEPWAKNKISGIQLEYPSDTKFERLVYNVLAKVGKIKIKYYVNNKYLYCYDETTKHCIWKLQVYLKDNHPRIPYILTALVACRLLIKDYYAKWITTYIPKLEAWMPSDALISRWQ